MDSFITYKNVLLNIEKAKADLNIYMASLKTKYEYLKILLERYDDGRSKSLYCQAVELLPTEQIEQILRNAKDEVDRENIELKEKAKMVVGMINELAKNLKIELALRK